MAAEQKRSYYLPKKLIEAFDKECKRQGFIHQRVAAASIHKFLAASPQERQQMFDNLAKFLTRRS